MGPTWGRQDPGGSHVGPMNFSIREVTIMNYDAKYSYIFDIDQESRFWMLAAYNSIFKAENKIGSNVYLIRIW